MGNYTSVRNGSKVYIRYLPDPDNPVDLWAANWPYIVDRKVTIDQCGLKKITLQSVTEIEVNGVMTPRANFTIKPISEMPFCKKIGTGYFKYVRKP